MHELSDSQFLDLLAQRSIQISLRDGRLHVSAPRGTVDPHLHAELARRKPYLLKALQAADAAPRPNALGPMPRDGKIPQTHAQQGIWLIDHFAPGNVAYNIPQAFAVEGAIDPQILQAAVDRVLARHESLRTFFYEDEGDLLQAVSNDAPAHLGFTDMSGIAVPDQDRELDRLIRGLSQQPFDLEHPPLVQFHLFRLANERHVIFFNIHHIIADARSLIILRKELAAFYEAIVRNQTAALPVLSIQYPDYAIWADRQLSGNAMARHLEYWKQKLAGAPPYFELSLSRPYPEQRTAWGDTVSIVIPQSVHDALNGIARQEGATLFMLLLAAFAILLHHHSGKEDFCLGSPFTYRKQVETESLIGLFVNMIVLRCQLDGRQNFREFLRRVRTTALEAYEHGELPFQELARALKPDLRSRRSPLFQIMFAFDADNGSRSDEMAQLDINPGTAKYDLTLQLHETPEEISGWFEYCTDLFDAAAVEQLSAQFLSLLGQIARQPDQPIAAMEAQASTAAPPGNAAPRA